ncbi:MAG: hypothetical protein J7M08_10655 [Planctomycetes bacterium]|nr:hypothetical protein [Planctomycetota bacterium]
MTKTKVLIVLSLAVAFGAGLALGRLTAQIAPHRSRRSWLDRELNLTPEQREQMKAIWSEVMGRLRESLPTWRGQFDDEQREAVRQILTEEQKERYEQIIEEQKQKREARSEQRRQAFQEAIERTKQILTPQQRDKYERLMGNMQERRGRSRRPRGMGRPEEHGKKTMEENGSPRELYEQR